MVDPSRDFRWPDDHLFSRYVNTPCDTPKPVESRPMEHRIEMPSAELLEKMTPRTAHRRMVFAQHGKPLGPRTMAEVNGATYVVCESIGALQVSGWSRGELREWHAQFCDCAVEVR